MAAADTEVRRRRPDETEPPLLKLKPGGGTQIDRVHGMGWFYGPLHLLGAACRLVGMVWGVYSLASGDWAHSARLAPAAALWFSKMAWGLVDAALRGADVALGDMAAPPPDIKLAVLQQALPVAGVLAGTAIAWRAHGVPTELTYASLAGALPEQDQAPQFALSAPARGG
jgi:hypothetical protein